MKGLLFTYLLTYGGAVASLINPFWGLLIYVCFAIIKPEALWHWSVPQGGNYSRIVAIALLAGWALHGFGNWRLGKSRGVLLAFVALWLWSIVCAVVAAENTRQALGFCEATAKVLLPFMAGLTLIKDVRQIKQLAWVILASQGYVALELNRSYYSGFNPLNNPWDTNFAGMDNNCVAIGMVSGAGMALFLALGASKWWQKGIALFAALLMAHCVIFSFSRGGLLSLIVLGGVSFLLIPKRPAHYALFIVAALVCVRLAGHEVLERFYTAFADQEERDYSAESRLDLWKACGTLMEENPVFGVGPNHFGHHAPRFGFPYGKSAHNTWLENGAEMGVPGLLLLAGFFWLAAFLLVPLIWRRSRVIDPWFRDVARMVVAGVFGYSFASLFVTLEGLELPYYLVLVGAGVLKVNSTARSGAVAPAARRRVVRQVQGRPVLQPAAS